MNPTAFHIASQTRPAFSDMSNPPPLQISWASELSVGINHAIDIDACNGIDDGRSHDRELDLTISCQRYRAKLSSEA